MMESQIEMADSKARNKQEELERQIKSLKEMLEHKETEIMRKNDVLEKEKRNVNELQRTIQNKLFEYDSQLQNERHLSRQKIDEAKTKIDQANQDIARVQNEKTDLQT